MFFTKFRMNVCLQLLIAYVILFIVLLSLYNAHKIQNSSHGSGSVYSLSNNAGGRNIKRYASHSARLPTTRQVVPVDYVSSTIVRPDLFQRLYRKKPKYPPEYSTLAHSKGREIPVWLDLFEDAVESGSHDNGHTTPHTYTDEEFRMKENFLQNHLPLTDVKEPSKEDNGDKTTPTNTVKPATTVTSKAEKTAYNISLEKSELVHTFALNNLKGATTESPFTLKADPHQGVEFYQKWEIIHKHRRAMVKQACQQYYNATSKINITLTPPGLYMDEKHKVLYCQTAKNAGTSWLRVFLVLSGNANSTFQFGQSQTIDIAKLELKSLRDVKNITLRQEILETYTKFMITRHPLERLLSAYNSEIGPNATEEHLKRCLEGNKKLRKSIYDKIVNPRICQYSNKTKILHRNKRVRSRRCERKYNKTSISEIPEFKHFLQFLSEKWKFKNPHWTVNVDKCLPCEVDYNIIGRYETLEDDARYILHAIGAEDSVAFPSSAGSAPTNSSKSDKLVQSYEAVPANIQEKLFQLYKLDFEIFGYKFKVYSSSNGSII